MEENGNLERIDQDYIAINFLERTDRKKDFAIDVDGIAPLEDYIRRKQEKEAEEQDVEGQEEMQTSGALVIPITFANGDTMDLVIGEDWLEIAGIYSSKDGQTTEIQLSPEIQKSILRESTGVQGKIDASMIISTLTPGTLEELQRSIVDENLVPQNKEEFAQRVNSKYPNLVQVSEDTEVTPEEMEEKEEEAEEKVETLPEELRDRIAKVCAENGLDITLLREALEAPPRDLNERLDNTGFQPNGSNVFLLRFGNKGFDANGNDRIIMVQDSLQIDERQYDSMMTDYMIEHRGEDPAKEKGHRHTIIYTDIDGNTTTQELHKEPRDLTYEEKELIQKELEKLQEAANGVKNNPNISKEDKEKLFMQINDKRKALFERYGIYPNLIMEEMEADQDTLEENVGKTEEQDEQERPEPDIDNEDNGEHGFPELGERGGFPFGNHRLF